MYYAVLSTFAGVIGTYSGETIEELQAELKTERVLETLDVGDKLEIIEE